jgi:hypothetical protein
VQAHRVVEAFYVAEAGHAGLGLGSEAATGEQFALERGEEAFTQGIVVGVARRSHGRAHARLAAASAERQGRVLAALVGVMDDSLRTSLAECHLQRV